MIVIAIVHRVSIPVPTTHLVHIETTVSAAAGAALPESLTFCMPTWTPGSYLVREYARHVEGLVVEVRARGGRGIEADGADTGTKCRKNAWTVRTKDALSVVVRYRVYAGELTVRTSHVDETHAFLVGAGLFFALEGHEGTPARVEIDVPPGWTVATALPPSVATHDRPLRCFDAADFDTLVDSPIEMGRHKVESFFVLGARHSYAICPANAVGASDVRRLVDDTRSIVETQAKFFGGALPYRTYDWLLHFASRGRGGLEHRSSAALVAPASSFATRDAYLDLLALVSHELFHAWNAKRIRPAGLSPYRYGEECYTRLLWWFEGGTSYYDWRTLALSRLCTVDEYLDHVAAEISYVDQTPGRLSHTLEEASFDAWIKLYRPDENLANSSVSYYRKGEVVCALLDIELAARTEGRVSLDSVLRHLWTEYGLTERPVPENAMQTIFERVADVSLEDLFGAWVRGKTEIEYETTLAHVGLGIERSSRSDASCSLGIRLRTEAGRAMVASVVRDSSAYLAGVAAGDELVAMGGVRVEGAHVDSQLRGRAPGQSIDLLLVRDATLVTKTVSLEAPRADRVKIIALPGAPARARDAFTAWLGQPHPAWCDALKDAE